MVLVWPNWFGLDHNDLVSTKMNWSGPNCDFLPKWITFGPDQFIFVVTISFWSWPNHYVQVQINLVRPKPYWTDQNCFGHIEGHGISKLWIFIKFAALNSASFLALLNRITEFIIQLTEWFWPHYAMWTFSRQNNWHNESPQHSKQQ